MATFDIPTDLSILSLSHPLLHPSSPSNKRTSDSSDQPDASSAINPTLLAADLQHYRDLFSKLRFSYVEQVTKERFLRAITSSPPEVVAAADNTALEAVLAREKAALKERKTEVAEVIKSIEEQGRSLVERYETLTLQHAQLSSLPHEIEQLESTIAQLRAHAEPVSDNPLLNLPLQATRDAIADREARVSDMDAEIARLQSARAGQEAEMERLKEEVDGLRARKERVVGEAQEARRRREGGRGGRDEVEEQGRWLRGVEAGLRGMLEV